MSKLTKYADIFKDKIGKMDRVNIPPVKLQLDETKNIPPVHITKPFDVAYHVRRPARKEFREMVEAEIEVEAENEVKAENEVEAENKDEAENEVEAENKDETENEVEVEREV